MHLFQTRIIPRTLRFLQPAGTSRGVYRERRVWYVAVRYEEGGRAAFGVGECAPLHDLSADYVSDADYANLLRSACVQLEQNEGRLDTEALRPYPSILFGLETALLSARASLEGDMFRLYDTPFMRSEEGIRINGLVWMGTQQEMLARMEEKLASGFTCVKLKIGAIDFEAEMELIRMLRKRFSPEYVELRVDANGAFRPDEALPKLERLARYGIHSIEQPIRQGQWADMRRICEQSPLPVALDEELIGLHTLEQKREMLREVKPAYVVLKPSLHGGLAGCGEWVREARARDIDYWVTSALESNVGLNAIAAWTSTLPEAHRRAQGLGTGMLFERNVEAAGLRIEGECLWRGTAEDASFREEARRFREAWSDETPTWSLQTSGSTGRPKRIVVEKARMRLSAETTCRTLGLRKGEDTALLCLPLAYVAGQMQCVRAMLWDMRLVAVKPSSHPLRDLRRAPDFAAMTPMQVYETLHGTRRERRLLRGIRELIIGGGAISPELEKELRNLPGRVWSTYGMTETLSHVALRRLNGDGASAYYTPLEGVEVALTEDGCLKLRAAVAGEGWLRMNDLAEFREDGRFRILGRRDNTVVSGGVKLQIESLEERLSDFPLPFALTSAPDERLGEMLVMVYAGGQGAGGETRAMTAGQAEAFCRQRLSRFEVPRRFVCVGTLPMTETGKTDRAEIRRLVRQ